MLGQVASVMHVIPLTMPIHLFTRLFFTIAMLSFNANAQHLFGNPSCADWLEWGAKEKLTWLNAYLVPLNLTNVARKKPSVDTFGQLPSLDPAVSYVGSFCDAHPDAFASVGAIRFLDELTREPRSK